ncbi:hypothetical protein BH24ACT22_BH24ACT22_21440 [soil metagenome]
MKIGEQLKRHRDDAMLTQEELGKRAGLGGFTISRIESNQVEPRVSTIRKIVGALGIGPEELTARPKAELLSLEWAMDQAVSTEAFSAAIAEAPDEAREDLQRQLMQQGQRLPNDRKWITGNPPKVLPPIVVERLRRLKALAPPPIARMRLSDEGNVCQWFIPPDQWEGHRADVDEFFDGEPYENFDAREESQVHEEALLYA